ncbi:protein kinase, ATP binding site-containing protein [Tanacetum coccineum]
MRIAKRIGSKGCTRGATNPEYVVAAHDIDKLIVVGCIPKDDQGRQGEIVRFFANDQNNIICDPKMQQEIDRNICTSQASFGVLLPAPYPFIGEKFKKSGMGKIRGKHFINGSKSVESDLGVKNDVGLSCDVSSEKFVKSVFGDREKGKSFNEQNGKFLEKRFNFHLFPMDELEIRMPYYSFSYQPSYLALMAREDFDFNVCIYDGISYLSKAQESAAKHQIENPVSSGLGAFISKSLFINMVEICLDRVQILLYG